MNKRLIKFICKASFVTMLILNLGKTVVNAEVTVPSQSNATLLADDKVEDFKENKEKAKEFGEKQTEQWKISASTRKIITTAAFDSKYSESYRENSFTEEGKLDADFLEKINVLRKAVGETLNPASVITYKNVSPNSIGFSKDLVINNKYTNDYSAFKNAMVGKDINLDGFPEMDLTSEKPASGQQVVIRGLLKKGASAGIITSADSVKALLEEGYALHVDSVSKTVIKGSSVVLVNGTFTMPTFDFKNDENLGDEAMLRQYEGDKWANKLNDNEKLAVMLYTGEWHTQINGFLEGHGPGSAVIDGLIRDLSGSLEKTPINTPVTVYRWIDPERIGLDNNATAAELTDSILGKQIENSGYMSTSINSTGSGGYSSRSMVLRLRLPKGTHAAYIKALDTVNFEHEREVLLDKGQTFTVDGIRKVVIKGKEKIIIDGTIVVK